MAITNITEALEALRDLAENLPEAGGEIPLLDLVAFGATDLATDGTEQTITLDSATASAWQDALSGGVVRVKISFLETEMIITPNVTRTGEEYMLSWTVYVGSISMASVTISIQGTTVYMFGLVEPTVKYYTDTQISLNKLDHDAIRVETSTNAANLAKHEADFDNPHHVAAGDISGTFSGTVKANDSYQSYAVSLLRNSVLSSTETSPTVNGEIVWQYS